MKVKKLLMVICLVVTVLLSGCDMSNLTDRFSRDTDNSGEYDYREMYLNNDTKDLKGRELEVFNAASRVYSIYMEDCTNDYDKVVAAHDYIVENCVYNKDAIDSDTLSDDDFEPYGVFIKGVAVCEGYAEAFKLLMDIAGIECNIVIGTVGEEETLHAWNMVKLDGDWYHVDVTFDDPYPETAEIVYLYLNVTDDILSKDHSWDKSETPEANSDEYEYIKRSGNECTSIGELKVLLDQCDREGSGYVSFVWTGEGMISDDIWQQVLRNTDIAGLTYSYLGADYRRLYMVNLEY